MPSLASCVGHERQRQSAAAREDVPEYFKMLTKSTTAKDRALAAEMLGKRRININGRAGRHRASEESPAEGLQHGGTRRRLAEALGRFRSDPGATVPLLIESLNVKNYNLHMAAVQAVLAAYGPDAKEALPRLRELKKELKNKKDDKIIGAAMNTIAARKKN